MATGLNAEQIDALLKLLSTDDDFRVLFQSDLGAAFKRLPGQPEPPPDLPPGCCLRPKQLATKKKLAESREALAAELLSLGPLKDFILEF